MVNESSKQTIHHVERLVPFWRRLAAMLYDTFVVFSFIILATAVALLLNHGHSFLPIRYLFLTYLLVSTGLFLSWFWQRGGQTLGMLAWKMKVVDGNGERLTWRKAFLRYWLAMVTLSAGGIGLWWCLFNKQKQSLHDLILKTKIVMR
jgi:uncharacterized RDD family membrane protein YckC